MTVPKDGFSAKWCMIHVAEFQRTISISRWTKVWQPVLLIAPRIVIQVKQTPRSNNNYKATINNLKECNQAQQTKNVIFEATVNNVGDNIIDAKVTLALANMQTAKEEKFNPVKVTVYPDGTGL
ncbi:MAG: hypothetical protein QM800_07760 [Paludibacter sp.]